MKLSESKLLFRKLKTFFPEIEPEEKQINAAASKILQLYSVEFGANLKKFRLKKNINQVPLCTLLGIAQTTYSSWETGAHSPRISYLDSLSSVLDIDIGELFPVSNDDLYKTVPLFVQSDFCSKLNREFFEYDLKHAEKKTRDYFNGDFDFAFLNDDESMIGHSDNIPLKSFVFCTAIKPNPSETNFQKIYSMCGKVVLLSIVKGPAILREIAFDGQYIRFKAWNPNVDDVICLTSEEQTLPNGNEKLAMFANHPLSASMIELFGVAKKIIKDVK